MLTNGTDNNLELYYSINYLQPDCLPLSLEGKLH